MSTERSNASLEAQLDALFGAYVVADQSPGLAYGLIGAEGLRHASGFGTANDDGVRPDQNTVFPIASMSKSFTALAVLLARDRGLLSLDDPITDYVPQFTGLGLQEECPPPTLRMLLSMSAGLTEDNAWVDPQIGMSEDELLALVAKGLRYSHLPGTVYEYSNVGFALTGLALERATGTPVEDFVTREILLPLGMTSTTFGPRTAREARASGYSLDVDEVWQAYDPVASGVFASVGGMESSIHDLSIWVTWLGAAFRPEDDTAGADIVSRSSRRELQRLESIDVPAMALRPAGHWSFSIGGYALGLRVEHDLHRGEIVSHGGGLPGYSLYMCWHPHSGTGIVVLTNSHRGNSSALAMEALHRTLHTGRVPAATVRLWPETVAARQAAESLIRDWDDQIAADLFAENVDFDRPLDERRAEIADAVAAVGPLLPSRPVREIVSATTAADVTWSIPATNGELICMVHLNALEPPRVQEFVVKIAGDDVPRSAAPWDVSPRRASLGQASQSSGSNVHVQVPTTT